MPTQIEFEGTNNKITYLYNSVGQKLKKTVVYSDSIKIVDYLDGFQAEERGSRMPVGAIATQLSNNEQNHTAALASFDLEILNFQSLTRPFGLKHSVYSAGRLRDFEVDSSNPEGEHVFLNNVTKTEYQYKYNGQEWQDELGLNMYAMDLRQYDPAIGRWVAQDPVTHFDYSPYSAFDNNPVFWADPSGADAVNIGYDREVAASEFSGSATSFKLDNIIESKETKRYTAIVGGDEPTQDTSNLTIDPCTSDYLSGSSAKTYNFTNTTYKRASSRGSTFGDLFSLPDYIRNAYKNNYDPRFSPYNPSGFSVTANLHFNALLGHGGGSLSFVMGHGQFGFVWDGYGGWGPSTVLGVSGGVDMGFLDLYGGATDLETELKEASTSWGGQVGPLGANYSTSTRPDGSIADEGVRQYNVNVLGWGLKGGKLGNTSVSGSKGFHNSGTKFFKF